MVTGAVNYAITDTFSQHSKDKSQRCNINSNFSVILCSGYEIARIVTVSPMMKLTRSLVNSAGQDDGLIRIFCSQFKEQR